MKNLCLCALLVAVVLLAAASVSYAGLIHEDISYWYKDGNAVLTQFNPSTDWISAHIPNLLAKVQETVFDADGAMAMLSGNGDGTAHPGCLYAYSITNLGVGSWIDPDKGLTGFALDWNPACVKYVTVDKATLPMWTVDDPSKPSWKWTGSGSYCLRPGETIGGFWAVSNVSVDGEVSASATHTGINAPETFSGRTTGPVPDAPTFLSLFAGLASLGLTRIRRRK
jgi:hypothetical protein